MRLFSTLLPVAPKNPQPGVLSVIALISTATILLDSLTDL